MPDINTLLDEIITEKTRKSCLDITSLNVDQNNADGRYDGKDPISSLGHWFNQAVREADLAIIGFKFRSEPAFELVNSFERLANELRCVDIFDQALPDLTTLDGGALSRETLQTINNTVSEVRAFQQRLRNAAKLLSKTSEHTHDYPGR